MKLKRNFLGFLLFSALAFSACTPSGKTDDIVHLTPSKTLSPQLGMPISMQWAKGRLVIVDYQATDGLVRLIDASTGKTTATIAPKGNGNNEMTEAPVAEVAKVGSKTIVNLYDLVKKRLLVYDFKHVEEGKQTSPSIVKMKTDERYYGINKIAQGYAALGLFENKKFELLDDSLRTVSSYGTYLESATPNGNKMINAMANYGRSAVSPDKSLLVNISYAAGVVRFYSVEGNTLKLKKDAVVKPLNYKVKGKDYENLEGMGFLAVAISDHYVYALYSGEKEDFKSPMPTGAKVYRYDYDGNLESIYELDSPTFTLAVDGEDKFLYSVADKKGYQINVYKLD